MPTAARGPDLDMASAVRNCVDLLVSTSPMLCACQHPPRPPSSASATIAAASSLYYPARSVLSTIPIR